MEKKEAKQKRSPVVVVMGHIDHGKSTLLDHIRKTRIVDSEAGGITQHMSAYEVEVPRITFLDTPGHEAFQAMRARGAKVADLAILVVAADDGVKPQTLEALKVIREEKIPFVVAINKIDKPEANIDRTKSTLMENEIYLEGMGGEVPFTEISAKTGKNVSDLLELITLVADLENFTADSEKLAEGFVLESNLDPKKGIVATIIIKDGTLKKGSFVASEKSLAPLRIMENFLGEKIEEASFSSPVRIIGWDKMPRVGATFQNFEKKKDAENYIENYKDNESVKPNKATETSGTKIIIPIIVKADTVGSLEAIEHELKKLDNENISFKIINSGVGAISEGDIKSSLSSPERAIVIGFNTKVDSSAEMISQREGIIIRDFNIIYKMTDWLKNDLADLLPKVEVEEITGKAQIIKIFSDEKSVQIVGGKVIEGLISQNEFRIKRRENLIGQGKVKELQHKKERVGEVESGSEFGAQIESKIPVSAGDVLEFFKVSKKSIKI